MVSPSHKKRERLAATTTTRVKSDLLISVGYSIIALALSTILMSVFSAHPRSGYGTTGLASGVFALLTGTFTVVSGRNPRPGYGETTLVLAIVLGIVMSVCIYVAYSSNAQKDDPTVFMILLIFSSIQCGLSVIVLLVTSIQICACCPFHRYFNEQIRDETNKRQATAKTSQIP